MALSRVFAGRFSARITEAISPGTVFLPMHWGALWTDNGEANLLTHPEACPISLQPELKACAVNLTPVKIEESFANFESGDKFLRDNGKIEREDVVKESASIKPVSI